MRKDATVLARAQESLQATCTARPCGLRLSEE